MTLLRTLPIISASILGLVGLGTALGSPSAPGKGISQAEAEATVGRACQPGELVYGPGVGCNKASVCYTINMLAVCTPAHQGDGCAICKLTADGKEGSCVITAGATGCCEKPAAPCGDKLVGLCNNNRCVVVGPSGQMCTGTSTDCY